MNPGRLTCGKARKQERRKVNPLTIESTVALHLVRKAVTGYEGLTEVEKLARISQEKAD
jgi:hypothetical protein